MAQSLVFASTDQVATLTFGGALIRRRARSLRRRQDVVRRHQKASELARAGLWDGTPVISLRRLPAAVARILRKTWAQDPPAARGPRCGRVRSERGEGAARPGRECPRAQSKIYMQTHTNSVRYLSAFVLAGIVFSRLTPVTVSRLLPHLYARNSQRSARASSQRRNMTSRWRRLSRRRRQRRALSLRTSSAARTREISHAW